MKKYLLAFLAVCMTFSACTLISGEDLDDLRSKIERLELRLENLCQETNDNISALSAIVNSLNDNDFIQKVDEIIENGRIIGYEITFTKKGVVCIYNGKDGEDGKDGKDGEDGKDGKDGIDGKNGVVPSISVRQWTDGLWYWTLDGEWILDKDGNKIRASAVDGEDGKDGKDGITPQLKIEDGNWYISYDNGATWTEIGRASGEDGKPGADAAAPESIFSDITMDGDNIYFTLIDGQVLTLSLNRQLKISFSDISKITVSAGKTVRIPYTITGADSKTLIECIADEGWYAKIEATDTQSGYVCVTAPDPIFDGKVLVLVNAGDGRTFMASLNIVNGRPMVDESTFYINYEGGELKVAVKTREDYNVSIPEACSWVTLAPDTKASERIDTLVFNVTKNNYTVGRPAVITLVNEWGESLESFKIYQYGNPTDDAIIVFDDTNVRSICIESFDIDGDGNLTVGEASTATSVGTVFKGKAIKYFDEFKYFTSVTSLQADAFSGCNKLRSIILPSSLRTIGSRAFHYSGDASYEPRIAIPEGVQTLGSEAFMISNFAKIKLSSTIQRMGNAVFSGCSHLLSIEIPEGVRSIEENCFYQCTSLHTVSLPSTIEDIGKNVFYGCSSLVNITLPEGLKSVGVDCFHECSSLKEVCISGNLTTLPNGIFWACSSLEKVVLSEGLEIIDGYAFYECTALKHVDIPATVKTFSAYCFAGSGLVDFAFPEGITEIPDRMFSGCAKLHSVSLPKGLKLVDYQAFERCSSLETIDIPDTVTELGNGAFRNAGLKSFTIPPLVTKIHDSLFEGCKSLATVVLNDNITEIGRWSFMNTALTSFIWPQAVTTIKNDCFRGCGSLREIILHDNITKIDVSAFRGSGITSFVVPKKVTEISSYTFYGCKRLKEITLHDGITKIGEQAFFETGLESFTLPPKVTVVSGGILKNCLSLKTITLHDDVRTIESSNSATSGLMGTFENCPLLESFTLPTLVQEIPQGMLKDCKSLKSLILGDYVTKIGTDAFFGCSSLEEFTLPPNVTEISSGMFKGCLSLKTVNLHDSLTKIGNEAFYACEALENIVIPDGVTTVENSFGGCFNLRSITFGKSVKTINGYDIFKGCQYLSEIRMLPTAPPTLGSANMFRDANSSLKIKVSATSVSAYRTANYWKDYSSKIVAGD